LKGRESKEQLRHQKVGGHRKKEGEKGGRAISIFSSKKKGGGEAGLGKKGRVSFLPKGKSEPGEKKNGDLPGKKKGLSSFGEKRRVKNFYFRFLGRKKKRGERGKMLDRF